MSLSPVATVLTTTSAFSLARANIDAIDHAAARSLYADVGEGRRGLRALGGQDGACCALAAAGFWAPRTWTRLFCAGVAQGSK